MDEVGSVGTLPWTCHILDPRTGIPYCGAQAGEGEGLLHGGLNSSNCEPCVDAAAKEPDAPPKCSTCHHYHADRDAGFFHGDAEYQAHLRRSAALDQLDEPGDNVCASCERQLRPIPWRPELDVCECDAKTENT
jgi:hypothetical protein